MLKIYRYKSVENLDTHEVGRMCHFRGEMSEDLRIVSREI